MIVFVGFVLPAFPHLVLSLVKGSLCNLTGCDWILHYFVLEHREIESEAQSDRVVGLEPPGHDIAALLISIVSALFKRFLFGLLHRPGAGLRGVPVVVADDFIKECSLFLVLFINLKLVGLDVSL